MYGQHKKAPNSKSSNKLASKFKRCQFCIQLNPLKVVKLNISNNHAFGFLKSRQFDAVNTLRFDDDIHITPGTSSEIYGFIMLMNYEAVECTTQILVPSNIQILWNVF